MPLKRKHIQITGIVQGVGFRPFVYRIATENHLAGFVQNTPEGVEIEVQGENEHLQKFLANLRDHPPLLSKIEEIVETNIPPIRESIFAIQESNPAGMPVTLISPDIGLCDACREELFNPQDRRYLYPFINCTHCGPRFTLIQKIPYDRKNTTMSSFVMCPDCQEEYDDPTNRRFHAQPNACPVCGPQVWFVNHRQNHINRETPVEEAIQLLRAGGTLAIKGLGGFHLACDAKNEEAVQWLRHRKHREEKPLALMVRDIDVTRTFTEISKIEAELLQSVEKPIVLLQKRKEGVIAKSIAPDNGFLGVMLPYTPLHSILLNKGPDVLVMTSGNLSDEAIVMENEIALENLSEIADGFLLHNREIFTRCDDSVMQVCQGKPKFVRRARGFAPVPIFLNPNHNEVLAVGGMYKNTFCLLKGNRGFLSPHIGDLESLETIEYFEKSIPHLQTLLQIHPKMIACDMHPDYVSTQWAYSQKDKQIIPVQHHHAHIASCLAENRVDGPVIGLALDGTGLGTDGQIWGGEVLIADLNGFKRKAHLKYVPMPGGDTVIREPLRMSMSWLYEVYQLENVQSDFATWSCLFFAIKCLPESVVNIVSQILENKSGHTQTSSLGRLFDSVSAFLGLCHIARFEGQPAMLLESQLYGLDTPAVNECYSFQVYNENEVLIINPVSMWQALIRDVERNLPVNVIALKFHKALVKIFVDVCITIRETCQLNAVALSGGCFQNRFLSSHLTSKLQDNGFIVYSHYKVPCNDGGLSLGQAVIASSQLNQASLSRHSDFT